MQHLRNGIVEGEPGIFPSPVARVLVGISRFARKRLRPPAPPPVTPAADPPPPPDSPQATA